MIPYGRQDINQADIDAVVSVLKSDFLTQGPYVPAFEKKVADYCKVKHVLAVNSATSALHIACLALGLGKGDWLWTTPITFVASSNCALYCGAQVDFIDINVETYNIDIDKLEKKLVIAEKEARLPKVIIPVHLCGLSCDVERIQQLAQKYDFKIIEDASHAIGGRYLDRPVGSCQYSDITVFSFHPVKIITTAEGGMALTNNDVLADKMALLRSHGITRDTEKMTHEPDGPWYYQQIDLGFNYRMTELQAALGVSQMDRLDEFVAKRHQIAERYEKLLSNLPVYTPQYHTEHAYSGLHLYAIRLNLDAIATTHKAVFDYLRMNDIGVNLHYIPVHTQPYYRDMGFKKGDFPEAERYYREAISLPMFPALTEDDQQRIVDVLSQALAQ
ncbi:UDP-4-amino-4,6-dideoxy-N-acetyl-beta-L-altrosamine transaminase [Pectobacterium parmentieri]|uniref:UDP-4-amino-4, 6-dideoxy-N-acetyl-beta-L-altrosamine transaminase n=1 Tax=Pectobacterium parmentieri TaxID=1905730 RepID=UPI0001B0D0E3|nr:UDP-4-amino-4,6-dideoxy-N-acetyl-beta-L-altrosamine transaminase [Pectobacterium parmentieri]ACX88776.1 UDP-4-keto-6-deoxy-N-acetylglucosamine 4-aminotransferase [Pectobacterium parmentieri WPP163]AYH32762.1 UDP-4-amino-4,6-dideoxy-N-acetyl-beta-L-altrosamine transaminase [Pectobacterium parmentieri]MCL6355536.1 UDP-4-amino-4,6-dideoxy-N-acetyl-beta-L-altrosamine transaminase [Pectobacterium parmentieri]MCL6380561.1 UDP-4-amino-4,6-dideoxy-N-acetyl-beta-L-altrosamine transaminase [Pectobacte